MNKNTPSLWLAYAPIPSALPNGLAFERLDTGEILDFPESWRQDPEGICHILQCNLDGNYEEQAPLFPNWW